MKTTTARGYVVVLAAKQGVASRVLRGSDSATRSFATRADGEAVACGICAGGRTVAYAASVSDVASSTWRAQHGFSA